jgi:uncharacterized membrane protein YgaE (UPF0421/DUF939 family)
MGFRVLKTAVAVTAAIYLAQFMGLSSPVSAGLLAILGIEVTKRKGIRSAAQRIAASILGLMFATLLFMLLGFHVWAVGLFIMIVYPILHRMKLSDGAVTGSVVMFHLFVNRSVDAISVLNEIELLIVGLGTATLINIAYMPKADKAIEACKQEVERLFSQIFGHITQHLRDHSVIWDGKELLEARESVEQGARLAERSIDNTLIFGVQTYWRVYFYMRGEQLESIFRMVDLVAQVYQMLPQGEFMASLFEELSIDVKEEYYTGHTEEKMHSLEKLFKQMPLPSTREEFEIRSAMLQLNRELAHYLSIAKQQKKQKPGHE